MLEVRGLAKRFGSITAVDNVSFAIADGVSFGLLGPNGAGKTTTISMIAGTVAPDSGDALINGESATRNPAVRKKIGYVPQELAIYQEISAVDNLRFFGSLYDLFGADVERAIDRVLPIVGLADRKSEPVKRFSGGMMRRLNIAVGLLHNPEVLILDEPTVGVDPQTRNAIFDTLTQLKHEGKTLLYTTHYMEEVERLCEEVAIMDHGKIVAFGPLETLKRSAIKQIVVQIFFEGEWNEAVAKGFPPLATVAVHGDELTAPLPDLSESLSELLLSLKAMGIQVKSLRSQATSLEEVFLHHTGRSLRD